MGPIGTRITADAGAAGWLGLIAEFRSIPATHASAQLRPTHTYEPKSHAILLQPVVKSGRW